MNNQITCQLKADFPLTKWHTMQVKSTAKFFVSVTSITDLKQVIIWAKKQALDIIPLGSGSNTIFCGYINALVLHINIKGKNITSRDTTHTIVSAYAGENWHNFVYWTLKQQCYGLENLSLIPGTVGAAPIQNIGAYGVELADTVVSLQAIELVSGNIHTFTVTQCRFGYRDSIFKNNYAKKYIICQVNFKLTNKLCLRLKHNEIQTYYDNLNTKLTDNKQAFRISEFICNLRKKKLPDPQLLYNSGSFFKNPIISENKLNLLKTQYPEIPAYKITDNWKLSAGWLIEQSGMKGYRDNYMGIYEKHALILVNYGEASTKEFKNIITKITNRVRVKFDILLQVEPDIYTTSSQHI